MKQLNVQLKFAILVTTFAISSCTIGNSYLNIENADSLYIVLEREKSPRSNILFKYTIEYWQRTPSGNSFKKNIIVHCNRDWEVGELLELGSTYKRANDGTYYFR